MNIQDAILRLSSYWAARDCLILPPCELEIPGAILHPDNFFRLLDPEPWRAAYLQPVRRPLDGRFGRHPYRLARHLQFHVVIKGSDEDVRDLYLKSVEDLGVELSTHDLRFSEWHWEAVSLDTWGLGWHVLIDGLGVTRMTFLHQVAGVELDPVAVELSYGVERLVMAMSRVKDVFRLPWSKNGPEYGELWRQDEIEMSRYAVEVADVRDIEMQIESYLAEARRARDAGLLRLAYEQAIKSILGIDLLEMRGALSAREREERLHKVRDLVVSVAERYLAAKTAPPAEVSPEEEVAPVETREAAENGAGANGADGTGEDAEETPEESS